MVATSEMNSVLMLIAVDFAGVLACLGGVLACLVGVLVYNLVVSWLEERQRNREFERSMAAFQAEAEAQHSSAMIAVTFSEGEDDVRLFN